MGAFQIMHDTHVHCTYVCIPTLSHDPVRVLVCMYVCFLHVYVASDPVRPLALRCMCIKNPLLPRVIFWEKRYCSIVHVYSCMYMSMESHD